MRSGGGFQSPIFLPLPLLEMLIFGLFRIISAPSPPLYSPCISLSFCFESPGRKRGEGQISGIHQSLSSDVISIPSISEDADKEEGWVECGKGGRNAGEEKWPTDMSFFLESDAGDSGAEHKFDKFVCDKNGTFLLLLFYFLSFPLFTRFSLFQNCGVLVFFLFFLVF